MDYRTERAQCVVCGWLTYTRCHVCLGDVAVCKGCMDIHSRTLVAPQYDVSEAHDEEN